MQQNESRGIPDFIGEVSVALDALLGKLNVPTRGRHGRQCKPERVGPILVHNRQWVNHVPLRLAHFLAFGIAHKRMDIHLPERNLPQELEAHHNHSRHPEKQDVEAGDERGGGVILLEFRCVVRPTECRERPQRRGEPCIKNVRVSDEVVLSAIGTVCRSTHAHVGFRFR